MILHVKVIRTRKTLAKEGFGLWREVEGIKGDFSSPVE